MEVERKIRHCRGKNVRDEIEVADVLYWSISETYKDTKRCVPLWATQGIRYQRRESTWAIYSGDGDICIALRTAESLLEDEAQSLEDRYDVEAPQQDERLVSYGGHDEQASQRQTNTESIKAKCLEFDVVSFDNATLQEEQERELSPENERERQIELPPASKPHIHSVHRDLYHYVRQGILDRNSDAFQPAFDLFRTTSAIEHFEKEAWPLDLLVTNDFVQTVHASTLHGMDLFLRPVNWILCKSSHDTVECVVLSPYEANELLPSIHQHKIVTLHVYSPRLNISMRSLEDLSFCSIPAVPQDWRSPPSTMLINLFAGQLYLQSHKEYLSVCRFLGIGFHTPQANVQVACDGFINPLNRKEFDCLMAKDCSFKLSPVEFLRCLIALRRKGQSAQRSHMGKILQGELLSEEDF